MLQCQSQFVDLANCYYAQQCCRSWPMQGSICRAPCTRDLSLDSIKLGLICWLLPSRAASPYPGLANPPALADGGSGGSTSTTSEPAAGVKAEMAEPRLYSGESSPVRQSDRSSNSSNGSTSGFMLPEGASCPSPASTQSRGQSLTEGGAHGETSSAETLNGYHTGTLRAPAAHLNDVTAPSGAGGGHSQGIGQRQGLGHVQGFARGPGTPTSARQSAEHMSPAARLRVRQGLGLSPRRGAGGSYAEGEAADGDASSEVDYEENVALWRETEAIAHDIQQVCTALKPLTHVPF